MADRSVEQSRLLWLAMYYLPLPWALYFAVVLIPFPSDDGWSLLYYQFPSRSYWLTYGLLLGVLSLLPWTVGRRNRRTLSKNWRRVLLRLFRGYVAAVVGLLIWLGVLQLSGFWVLLDGEGLVFAILLALYVPPLWAPVVGALLKPRNINRSAMEGNA